MANEEGDIGNVENPGSQATLRSPGPPTPSLCGQSNHDNTGLNTVLRITSSPTVSSENSDNGETRLSPSPGRFTFAIPPPTSSDDQNPGPSQVRQSPPSPTIPIASSYERNTTAPCYACGQHRFISSPPTFELLRRVYPEYNLPVYNPPVSPPAISPPPYRPSGGYVYQSQPMGMPPSPGIPDGLDSYVPYWAFTPRQ